MSEIYKNSKYKVIVKHASPKAERYNYWDRPFAERMANPVVEGICLYDGVEDFESWYEVINLATEVAEHRCPTLPEALAAAHNLEDQLITEPWVEALKAQKQFRQSMLDDRDDVLPTPVTPVN